MKTRVGSALAAFFCLSCLDASVTAQPGPDEPAPLLPLADAVIYALARNDRVVDARDAARSAGLGHELAESRFSPRVLPNLLGSLGQADIRNQTYGVGYTQQFRTGTRLSGNVAATTLQNQLGSFANSDVTFQVSQSVLRGFGRTIAQRDVASARRRVDDAVRSSRLAEQQVAVDVASAYYRMVASEQLLRAAEQGRQRSRSLSDASQARLLVGRVSRLDVLRAQQLVSEADLRVLDARTAIEEMADQLRGLMNWAVDRRFTVVSQIPVPAAIEPLDDAVRVALDNRPEVATARSAVEDAQDAVAVARNSLLPQFDVSLAVTRRETAAGIRDSFGTNGFRLATFFEMSTPLDRTPQRVTHMNARIEVGRRQRELDTAERQTRLEVRRVVRHVERVRQALALSSSRVELARQELEAATYRFEAGLADTFDMVTAETNLLGSEGAELGLRAELAVAWLQMKAVLGTLDPRRDVR